MRCDFRDSPAEECLVKIAQRDRYKATRNLDALIKLELLEFKVPRIHPATG